MRAIDETEEGKSDLSRTEESQLDCSRRTILENILENGRLLEAGERRHHYIRTDESGEG
jgi:hypothetical protein